MHGDDGEGNIHGINEQQIKEDSGQSEKFGVLLGCFEAVIGSDPSRTGRSLPGAEKHGRLLSEISCVQDSLSKQVHLLWSAYFVEVP